MKWHIASVSWGKDSLAMLITLIAKGYPLNEVVFYDTGMEFEAIYHTRDQMLPRLEQLGIKYTRLEPENPFLFDMLERPVCSKQKGTHQGYGWCGGLCRWGTTGKLKAIDRYAEARDAMVYVGIAADETPRRKVNLPDFPAIVRAAMADGMDICVYCQSFGCNECIVNEWKSERSDEE